jgi:2-dehydro-3-deoxyphosphogluconate aldolase/(4S)-4-hydroxy-2-oxoglutarate aldolase
MPTGGVDIGNAANWFEAGAFALGAGSSLIPRDLLRRSAWNELAAHAERFREACGPPPPSPLGPVKDFYSLASRIAS